MLVVMTPSPGQREQPELIDCIDEIRHHRAIPDLRVLQQMRDCRRVVRKRSRVASGCAARPLSLAKHRSYFRLSCLDARVDHQPPAAAMAMRYS
jgi:hypothetical protein